MIMVDNLLLMVFILVKCIKIIIWEAGRYSWVRVIRIMLGKKYTALFLAVLVAAAEANSVNLKTLLANRLEGQERWDGFGLSASVNDYVDDTIGMLVPFIRTHGLDPMPLPDVEEGFEVRVLLITYSAWLRITNGHMTGLVNVGRSGDQTVSYFAKMLRVRLHLQFTNIEFVYNYLVKVMNIGPTGGIRGSLERFVVNIDLLLDFNNDEIHLQTFSLTDIGRLRVRLTGNLLIDWLVNPVISVFVRIIDTIVMKVVESTINSAIQDGIDFINKNVKETVKVIESYN